MTILHCAPMPYIDTHMGIKQNKKNKNTLNYIQL